MGNADLLVMIAHRVEMDRRGLWFVVCGLWLVDWWESHGTWGGLWREVAHADKRLLLAPVHSPALRYCTNAERVGVWMAWFVLCGVERVTAER